MIDAEAEEGIKAYLAAEAGRGALRKSLEAQRGKIGYILLWLLGIPIPVLFAIFLLRGCN